MTVKAIRFNFYPKFDRGVKKSNASPFLDPTILGVGREVSFMLNKEENKGPATPLEARFQIQA